MSSKSFRVSITPDEVYEIVGNFDGANILHQELKDFGNGSAYAVMV